MSIAYLDPGNVESDLQAGAAAEYKVRLSAQYDVERLTLGFAYLGFKVQLYNVQFRYMVRSKL